MLSLKNFILAALSASAAVQACNPAQYTCSGHEGAPADGGLNIYTCNQAGIWILSSQCGNNCCEYASDLSNAHCC